MLHTCKSLWQSIKDKYPELEQYLPNVAKYCEDAERQNHMYNYNRSFNSLKWAVYGLREVIQPKMLESFFASVLTEAAISGREHDLFNNIKSFKAFQPYDDLVITPTITGDSITINGVRVYVNDSDYNLTSLIFKKELADVVVFRNSKGHAGIIWREKDRDGNDTGIVEKFNIPAIFEILSKRNEHWAMVGRNLIICGGSKNPQYRTTITTTELVKLLEDNTVQSSNS